MIRKTFGTTEIARFRQVFRFYQGPVWTGLTVVYLRRTPHFNLTKLPTWHCGEASRYPWWPNGIVDNTRMASKCGQRMRTLQCPLKWKHGLCFFNSQSKKVCIIVTIECLNLYLFICFYYCFPIAANQQKLHAKCTNVRKLQDVDFPLDTI